MTRVGWPRLPARPTAVRLLAVMPAFASACPAGSVTWRKVSRAFDESKRSTCHDGGASGEGARTGRGEATPMIDPAQRRPVTAICGGSIAAPGRRPARHEGGQPHVKSYPTD